jgi:hypothetical protein
MWIDEYIDMVKREGLMDALEGQIVSRVGHEDAKSRDVHAKWDIIAGELKRMNENLEKNSCSILCFYILY